MYRVRKALTLIEVLIIIVIMLILARIVVPKLSQASIDTREETLRSGLRTLRAQISRYRDDHNGCCPDGDRFVLQLTMRTNKAGQVMPPGGNIEDYPCGPYLQQVPENPFVNRRLARRVEVGFAAGGGGNTGWYYNARNGALYPDNDAHSDL